MTGYGESSHQGNTLAVAIELRSVNNRYLKVSLRAPESYQILEPEFEKAVRKLVRRGTVQINLRVNRVRETQEHSLRLDVLQGYLNQVSKVAQESNLPHEARCFLMGNVLHLPGIVPEGQIGAKTLDEDWPQIEKTLEIALEKLQAMRSTEGGVMGLELMALRNKIFEHLGSIKVLIPQVMDAYKERLLERVRKLLESTEAHVQPSDLIREVAIFAERSDIAEEVTRLDSHLEQFGKVLEQEEGAGRKLEFLTQEMVRETNTMGSKAADVKITRHVVEIKGDLERIRELIQNVE
ncbi:MAG: YicC family protein [Planctomycetes bacterium]|nr:YicC family protein [Planctomycetota bacterium]